MRPNPLEWRIAAVASVCRAHSGLCTAPRKRSDYKVKHASMEAILTIPAHRPIKPVYSRDLVSFIDAVRKAEQ